MVLKERNKSNNVELSTQDLQHFLGGFEEDDYRVESIWSIEIALALRHFGCEWVKFLTTYKGVRKTYQTLSFYEKDFCEDCPRVERAFEKASTHDVEVVEQSLRNEDMERLVERSEVALIVLVDKCVLENGYFEDGAVVGVEKYKNTWHPDGSFVGHYVVVVGVIGDFFIINDPARESVFRVKKSVIHEARRRFGTDEDIVVVARNKNGGYVRVS